MKEYMPYVTRRAQRWAGNYPSLEHCNGKYLPDPEARLTKSMKLKRFCRKGIPNALRPHVWMEMSGAGQSLRANKGYYDRLIQGQGMKYDEQIRLDVPRTFPNNTHFLPDGSKYQVLLHRLLLAYSNHNPAVGYCQGMNYVAGLLLLVMGGNEEHAFWLFDGMVKLLPKGLYDEDMLGIQTECATFTEILKADFPGIASALQARGALEVMPAIVIKWFINAFVDTVPEETLLRIWDTLFYEGWKVIYRVGVAILTKAHKSGELLTHDNNSILEFLASIGWSAFDCNELITEAFEGFDGQKALPRRRIESMRSKNRAAPDAPPR